MKKLIVISMILLFAVPAAADYKADRAELMASAGLFNIAALDNPAFTEQAKGMASDTSRGRVSLRGTVNVGGKDMRLNGDYVGDIDHPMLSKYRFSGTAADDVAKVNFTFYYNNGYLTSTNVSSDNHGNNRETTYYGSTGLSVYSSRRP